MRETPEGRSQRGEPREVLVGCRKVGTEVERKREENFLGRVEH